MKRIKAACITQTVCFSNHDGDTSKYAKKMICQEYEKYKVQLDRSRTKYKILPEKMNEDGSIIIEIKKQYNTSPVGDYLS
ncbi:putative uncharacterized protein [Clostridium sp. CAG:81]|nr:hypothetical protein [bacterium 210820-DFI.6.38]CCY10772.1 putative uncharacterized protein [Clostridium sp. CAG:81]